MPNASSSMTNPNIETFEPPIDIRIDELSKLSELLGQFMRIERATYRDGRPETNAEHTLHTMFLAVAYVSKYRPDLDPTSVALLLMVHDVDELYIGDVNSFIASDETLEDKEADEMTSHESVRRDFADYPFVLELFERYWAQDDPEAECARSFEKTDPGFSHIHDGGRAIRVMGVESRDQFEKLEQRTVTRMGEYASADVLALRKELGKRVADTAFGTV